MSDLFNDSPTAAPTYRIVTLEAENVKRLKAVVIKPDSNLIEITGRNGQGKTSVLDTIWWAMKGKGVVQAMPIRRGCEEARIKLDLGAMRIERKFKVAKEGDGYTTSIAVESADGARYPSPQKLLDSLMGELSIDPLAFMRMGQSEQFDVLRGYVADFDFDGHERTQNKDYDARTAENRKALEAREQAKGIAVPDNLPDAPIDDGALTDQLASAGQHNAAIETKLAQRQGAEKHIAELQRQRGEVEASLPKRRERLLQRRDEALEKVRQQIAALELQAIQINEDADTDLTSIHAEVQLQFAEIDAVISSSEQFLDQSALLPGVIDITALRDQITRAQQINAGIEARNRRQGLTGRAAAAEAAAAKLTAAMKAREAGKAEAIAKASLPIPGIELGAGTLLLNGTPLDQASDAEQLRVSVAIAMSMHPRLRVIRVRDGNVLDEDGMRLLAELADQHDCQVWVETVRHDGRVAFTIEDGGLQADTEAE